MDETTKESEAIKWNPVWVAMQELAAALRPIMERGDAPEWAVELNNALVDADDEATNDHAPRGA